MAKMDEDTTIRVLHYHNPHLMWIEVKKHDTFTMRQVGLFGLVPMQGSLVGGEQVYSRGDRWDPRVDEIVEEFLQSKHLRFKSTYRLDDDEKPTSIFSNQPHIFGEISFKMQDGVKKQLSNCLENSVYAHKSKNEFLQMLTEGKIQTILKEDQVVVLKKIMQHYQAKGTWHKKKDTFFQHLSPSQVAMLDDIPSQKLTSENLKKFLKLSSKHKVSSTKIPKDLTSEGQPRHRNYQDINYNSNDLEPVEFVENVIKKFTVVEHKPKTGKSRENKNVKVPTGSNEIDTWDTGDDFNNNGVGALGRANRIEQNSENLAPGSNKKFEELLKLKEKCKRNVSKTESPIVSRNSNENDEQISDFNKNVSHNSYENEEFIENKKSRNRRKDKKSDYNSNNYEETSSNDSPSNKSAELLIAYGPPINNLHSLVWKLEVKTEETSTKQVEDSETMKTGNIDWDDANERTKFVKSDEENCYYKTANVENNTDLSNLQNYNDFVHKTQAYNDTKIKNCNSFKSKLEMKDDEYTDKNEAGAISISLQNSNIGKNREIKNTSTKNSKSKLLEIMRKRAESKFNDSLSSTDDNKSVEIERKHRLKDISAESNSDKRFNDTSPTNADCISAKELDSDIDDLEEIHAKLNPKTQTIIKNERKIEIPKAKVHVNPYKNLDGSKSVFVDYLIEPLLLAHSKNGNKILPQSNLRDIPFKVEIHNTLRNMQVKSPSRLQSVTWPYILRGHSMIMISGPGSGKTLGYLPAVCNLVLDYNYNFAGLGPICIIVCATALSVSSVAKKCRMFVNQQRVLSCYPGLDNLKLLTDLTNGCDIIVSTPSMLYRLLQAEIGVDLRRLTTLVFEDCERLSIEYELEVKAVQLFVKQMLKSRTDKQVQVQYILASRKWCDFMNPLSRKAPDAIITFASFHECILYSKTDTSVSFVKKDNKVDAVVEFLKETDESKLTVIVCRSDEEIEQLESTLTRLNFTVVACNNQMTIHDLYKLRTDELSSILICCDNVLNHLNVRYANYLVHYSMPALYTQFCARFAVLIENYPSIFGPTNENVKIKILLEETNVEQLPKILNFVKRCSSTIPEVLNDVARKVLEKKDLAKAERMVPVCDSLLTLGECVDFYSCQERHAILQDYDEPKSWLPHDGTITFKIIHYNSAVSYSARLLTHTTGNEKIKYPETYGTLSMKLGMFFSKEENKRLHGEPKVGDICAVAIRKNFIARCQVLKINDYEKGHAKDVIINLIDEEQITVIRAVELYYLPEKFIDIETHVIKVRLTNIMPKDKDVTFSELAMNTLKKITDEDEQLYLKGRIVMTVGNNIFVETLEACADLSALRETVVKYDFKKLLLATHAIPNPDHLLKLQKLCDIGKLKIRTPEVVKPKTRTVKREIEYRWAHLDKNDWSEVIFANTINAGKFFVRPQKFDKCVNYLISDIKRHVDENPKPIESVSVKDIVLAEFPDDSVYERAMVEEIIDDTKVRCFFVDNADWRNVAINKLKPISQKLIKQIPFQSIECRLIGIKPPSADWSEFSTNWLHDNCLEDDSGNSKIMYVKYYTKEKAEVTGGHKYGVVLVDTTTEDDLVINKRMIELNLAAVEEKEFEHLKKPLDFVREITDTSSFEEDLEEHDTEPQIKNVDGTKKLIPIPIKLIPKEDEQSHWETNDAVTKNYDKIMPIVPKNQHTDEVPRVPLKNIFAEKPIRSFPLVGDSDEDFDKWDVCIDEDLGKCFGLPKLSQSYNDAYKTRSDTENAHFEKSSVVQRKENATSDNNKTTIPKNLQIPSIAHVKNREIIAKDKLIIQNDFIKHEHNVKHRDDKIELKDETDYDDLIQKHTKIRNKSKKEVIERACKIIELENVHKSGYPNSVKETDTNIYQKVDTNSKDIEVLDTSGELELTKSTDILKGEIKDVSLYDSDDSLSISTDDKIESTNNKHSQNHSLIKDISVLDSDDTQSILTENEKEISFEEPKNELSKSILDSDDFETEDVDDFNHKIPRVEDRKTKTIHTIKNDIKIIKTVKLNHDDEQTQNLKAATTNEFKGKKITIKTIPKSEDVPKRSVVLNDIVEIKKSEKDINESTTGVVNIKKTEVTNMDQMSEINNEQNKTANQIVNTDRKGKTITITETSELVRTPQLVWRQNKNIITIKIKLVVNEYSLESGNRSLKFSAYQNEVKYAFEIELYGVIDHEKTKHSNKGQYILVTLSILLKKTSKWLKLTKSSIKNWIVYDIDSIDTSSDEDSPCNDDALKILMDNHEKALEIDDDDDDDGLDDTSCYRYTDD